MKYRFRRRSGRARYRLHNKPEEMCLAVSVWTLVVVTSIVVAELDGASMPTAHRTRNDSQEKFRITIPNVFDLSTGESS